MNLPDDKEPKYTECQMEFQKALHLLLTAWKLSACVTNSVPHKNLATDIAAFLEPYGYVFKREV